MGTLNIIEKIEKYLLSRFLLLKLETHEMVAKLVTLLLSSFLYITMTLIIMVFIGITFSILIGDYLGNLAFGYGVVSIIYIIILLILIIFRKKLIEDPVMNTTIKKFNRTEKDEQEKKEAND